MRCLARFGRRFFAFRSLWPSRRLTWPGGDSPSRRGRQCRQLFGGQRLEPRLALTSAAIDVETPAWDSCVQLVGRTSGLDGILHSVFGGPGTDPVVFDRRVAVVEKQLVAGTKALGVGFRVLDASVMGSHEGAYSASAPDGPTIYIRADLLRGQSDLLRSVVFEELGHHLDTVLNGGVDSRGDEGELFSARMRGEMLEDARMSQGLTEDDHGALVVGGQTVAVEFATLGAATRAVTYTEAGARVALQPTVTVARGRNLNIRSVTLAVGAVNAADRISVSGARSGRSSGTSPLAAGLAVPVARMSGTFYLGPQGGAAERWNYSITPAGSYAFSLIGRAGPSSSVAAQRLIRAVRYDSTTNNPVTNSRTFTWRIAGSVPTAVVREAVVIAAVNNPPTVVAASVTTGLSEAGTVGGGVQAASVSLTKVDVDGSVSYDNTWLLANGWATANGGVTYAKQGTYGTAALTVATDTVSYLLDNTLPTTQALAVGQQVSESFAVGVIDNGGATAVANALFVIVGSNDAPVLSGAAVVLTDGAADTAFTVSVADLLAGFTDWETDALTVANVACSSAAGTVVHSVVANGTTSYTVTPVAGYSGPATLAYVVVDSLGAATTATKQFVFVPPALMVVAP